MDRRLLLHEELVEILGSRNVYFQPPESIKLKYPCVIYDRYSGAHRYADNKTYAYTQAYEVTYIDLDPDSNTTFRENLLEKLKMVRYNRSFKNDNLNHDVYVVYY